MEDSLKKIRRRRCRRITELCDLYEGESEEQIVSLNSDEGGGGKGVTIFPLEGSENSTGANKIHADLESSNMAETLLPAQERISVPVLVINKSETTVEWAVNRQRGSH